MRKGARVNNSAYEPLMQHSILTQDRVKELSERIKEGCHQSREELFNHNLKLAQMFVSQRSKRYPQIPPDEMLHIVVLAIWKATATYDYNKGQFSTHASWQVRRYLNDYMEKCSRVVKVPSKAKEYRNQQIISIDDSPEEDGGWCVHSDFVFPEDYFAAEKVHEALSSLSEKERDIVESLYALNGRERVDLRGLSRRHGCSHEWVRKIKERAIRKMKIKLNQVGLERSYA